MATLGPDPLADDFDRAALAALLAKAGRSQLKGVLKDQRVIAGIGNAYSDEILHVARMSPFKPASSLSDEELTTLYDAIRTELTGAIQRAEGLAAKDLKSEKKSGCGCTAARGSRVRCAGTPSRRSRSPTRPCSTARPARPAVRSWPTGGCPAC